MTTVELIAHLDCLNGIADMIIVEEQRLIQLIEIKKSRNYIFCTHDEISKDRLKFSHQIEIKKKTIERLKKYFINKLTPHYEHENQG